MARFLDMANLCNFEFVIIKQQLVHVLETVKMKYLVYLQFTFTNQKKFFCNFGNYLKGIFGNHLSVNVCQNVKFCDIVKIWRMLIFVKSHFFKLEQ